MVRGNVGGPEFQFRHVLELLIINKS